MSVFNTISDYLSRWVDDVVTVVIAVRSRLGGMRTITLLERPDGVFSAEPRTARSKGKSEAVALRFEGGRVVSVGAADVTAALRGASVELVMQPTHYLFRPLELPARAAEFLGGVVRGQIDRLTPWPVERAVFGWSEPDASSGGSITVTVAAMAKDSIAPYLEALDREGIRSVAVSAMRPDRPAAERPITVIDRDLRGGADDRHVRRAVVGVLIASLMLAAVATVAGAFVGMQLEAQQDDLARRVTERRTAMLAARSAQGDPTSAAERALIDKKYQTPSVAVVLEVLSRLLPDHTYVTELRIEAGSMRLVGFTADAPGLIRLFEQSEHFSGATFFAPTTRAPGDSGYRFNIEARLRPTFTL